MTDFIIRSRIEVILCMFLFYYYLFFVLPNFLIKSCNKNNPDIEKWGLNLFCKYPHSGPHFFDSPKLLGTDIRVIFLTWLYTDLPTNSWTLTFSTLSRSFNVEPYGCPGVPSNMYDANSGLHNSSVWVESRSSKISSPRKTSWILSGKKN